MVFVMVYDHTKSLYLFIYTRRWNITQKNPTHTDTAVAEAMAEGWQKRTNEKKINKTATTTTALAGQTYSYICMLEVRP